MLEITIDYLSKDEVIKSARFFPVYHLSFPTHLEPQQSRELALTSNPKLPLTGLEKSGPG